MAHSPAARAEGPGVPQSRLVGMTTAESQRSVPGALAAASPWPRVTEKQPAQEALRLDGPSPEPPAPQHHASPCTLGTECDPVSCPLPLPSDRKGARGRAKGLSRMGGDGDRWAAGWARLMLDPWTEGRPAPPPPSPHLLWEVSSCAAAPKPTSFQNSPPNTPDLQTQRKGS